jgi:hypothetical protein
MNTRRIITIAALCLTIINVVRAQGISKYLDDGGFTNKKNIIKIGFDPINNEIPLSYERGLGKHFGLELGGGIVSLNRQYNFYADNPYSIESTGLGYNGWIRIKGYPRFFPERVYWAFQGRLNNLSGYWFTDIIFGSVGYQRVVVGNWVLDGNLGFGVRLYKDHTVSAQYYGEDRASQFVVTLTIETGYLF